MGYSPRETHTETIYIHLVRIVKEYSLEEAIHLLRKFIQMIADQFIAYRMIE